MFSGHGFRLGSDDVGPRQEIVDLAVRVAVDDPGEHVGYGTLRRSRRKRLEELRTGDGRALPTYLKAQIGCELDRLECKRPPDPVFRCPLKIGTLSWYPCAEGRLAGFADRP